MGLHFHTASIHPVFVPPVVIGATTVNETDALTLSCDHSGSSPPPTISWFAPDGSGIQAVGGSITIDDIQRSQSGNYTCVLTSTSDDTRSTSVVVTVQCKYVAFNRCSCEECVCVCVCVCACVVVLDNILIILQLLQYLYRQ